MINFNIEEFEISEIESIEFVGEAETIDIFVEDTHMFFANDIYTHNSGINSDVITEEMIGEAYAKVQVADFVGSLSSKNFYIIKNRIGIAKKVFPIKIDQTRSLIEIMDPYETSNIDEIIQHSEKNETKILKEVYKKFKDNKGLE